MPNKILESHDHYCFHSAVLKFHSHPDLHHCDDEKCPTAIRPDVAERAGLVKENGEIACPSCGCKTTLKTGEKRAEVQAKLCTDPTIHYPELYKAGKLDAETFNAWKATLTDKELLGHYRRLPDLHVVVHFTHDETSLIETNPSAFDQMLNERIREQSEKLLIHQVQYRYDTTTSPLSL
jgi:uncharacterized Zn finger protein (UPF0148 family)